MIHELKTIPEYFQMVWDDKKNFEVRKNDRDFKVGDELHLREFDPDTQTYTGRGMSQKRVKYILNDPQFVKEGFVILGME